MAVKLSPYFSSTGEMALRLDEAGADALVLFNRFLQPDIDPETLAVVPEVGLSSPAEARLPRTWIALLHGRVRASLAATTGVETPADVAKYLLAGADVVMTASALLRHGPEHATVLARRPLGLDDAEGVRDRRRAARAARRAARRRRGALRAGGLRRRAARREHGNVYSATTRSHLYLRAKAGKREELLDVLGRLEILTAIRDQPGFLGAELQVPFDDEDDVLLSTAWASREHYERWLIRRRPRRHPRRGRRPRRRGTLDSPLPRQPTRSSNPQPARPICRCAASIRSTGVGWLKNAR